MPIEEREPSGDYTSIEDIAECMATTTRIPPPLPGSISNQAQNEYMNPTYRPGSTYNNGRKEPSKKDNIKTTAWWVWILMGLCMVIIIMLLLVLVFTFSDKCSTEMDSSVIATKANTSNQNQLGVARTPAADPCSGSTKIRHANFSCADLRKAGIKKSGVYTIFPTPENPVEVFCDMEHDAGGWTVIHNRFDGSTNFYRRWIEFLNGFGSAEGEYWFGLENMHRLTHEESMSLYIYLEDWENNTRYALYDHFYISPSNYGFFMIVQSYRGTAGDGMLISKGKTFSAFDQGHACSSRTRSAWWFTRCESNLNGFYLQGVLNSTQVGGMVWRPWRGIKYSLKSAQMMVRPTEFVYDLLSCKEL